MNFKLVSDYQPTGDQPTAIETLASGYLHGHDRQVLLGVTGSGKTFTMANVIQKLGVPTIVIAHNKTLAAQLYGEFKRFFPENAVEYFVSYYDYYQPEAYVPSSDTYIEKDSSINEEIDKLRHSATRSLLERRDVIIVASVSCIYGLGSPEAYSGMLIVLEAGDDVIMDEVLEKLVEIQYERNDYDFHRGTYRVKGDVIEVFPAHESDVAYRIEFFGDEVDRLSEFDPLTGKTVKERPKLAIYPATHYVTTKLSRDEAVEEIRKELLQRVSDLEAADKLVEAQRLTQRTMYDIEMIKETGYCNGIENYSRIIEGRTPGDPPPTLLSYLPKDALVIVDESHITLPQVRGMFKGDRSRKTTLVEFGFRIPAALDNRPLKYEEFDAAIGKVMYVSATPDNYEIQRSQHRIAEQVIRPTGLIDPAIEVRPARTQVDDLYSEVLAAVEKGERVLVTTLTKRMAEELTKYYKEMGVRVEYLHSEIDTLERIRIIRDLRLGKFDVLVGINLLREGLDIPEVGLVAILDADKEGFLRSEKSLIQTIGRAARNVTGRAIFYGDRITDTMKRAMEETERRRQRQLEYNEANGITPETIKSNIDNILTSIYEQDYVTIDLHEDIGVELTGKPDEDIDALEREMFRLSEAMEFEKAARIRDFLFDYKARRDTGTKKRA